jgi:hypothetical protein
LNFGWESRSVAAEVYATLAFDAAVTEIYIVPVDFDPDKLDERTGEPQAPIVTLERAMVDNGKVRLAGTVEDRASRSSSTEVEIFEYREMRRQIAGLRSVAADEAQIVDLAYPAVASPQIITRTRAGQPMFGSEEPDRLGLVYALPFYDPRGAFKGIVAAVISSAALSHLLSDGTYALWSAH